jgi:hypothetical protein
MCRMNSSVNVVRVRYGLLPSRLLLEPRNRQIDVVRQHLLRLLSRPSALQSIDVLAFLELSVMRGSNHLEPSIKEGMVTFSYHNR